VFINALPALTIPATLAAVPLLSPWQRLVVVIVPLYAAIKAAVVATGPRPHGPALAAALAWPGFDLRPFRTRNTRVRGLAAAAAASPRARAMGEAGCVRVLRAVHELAISVPVGRGFGMPMAYFVLHAGLTGLEPRLGVTRWPTPLAPGMP